jgi:hypothetical protein
LRIPSYQPLILGWRERRADFRAMYGFLAPTGRFEAGTKNNVGSGYWTSVLSSGHTIYTRQRPYPRSRCMSFMALSKARWSTQAKPLNLDYSLTQALAVQGNLRLQLGLIGYGQWQTTDKHGPTITPERGNGTLQSQRSRVRGQRNIPMAQGKCRR